MKRVQMVVVGALCCLAFACVSNAQMGMDFFKRPAISSVVHPVVGHGGAYETIKENGRKEVFEMSVVGKDSVDGKEAFWLEFGHMDERAGQMMYGKMLFTKDDFQFHRMIFQQPGQPAMEMPFNPSGRAHKDMEEELNKWHSAGTDTITVPAGTFSCQHWQKNDGKGDVWTSDKVSPYGLVKEVDSNGTMVLTKLITDAQDHITGPVKQFDPQAFRQQMMDQMQKRKQNP